MRNDCANDVHMILAIIYETQYRKRAYEAKHVCSTRVGVKVPQTQPGVA